jgi:hypothetical protein
MNPTFSGEVMLAGWSETHNGGAKVTFWLSDADELAAFKRMTVTKGKTAGQRLACVLVEIGDDELPKEPEPPTPASDREMPPTPAEERKGGPLAKLAGMWCQRQDFQEWCGQSNADQAREFILDTCGIDSRVELDHNPKAAEKFHEEIRLQFADWLKETGRAACQVT